MTETEIKPEEVLNKELEGKMIFWLIRFCRELDFKLTLNKTR